MDSVHIHLAITHLPIMGILIGLGILIYGYFAKNETIKKVALVLFMLMAILTIPVFLSGEEAEETVEHIDGFSQHYIHEHEELAEKIIWLVALLGCSALFNFYALSKKLSYAKSATQLTIALSILTFGLLAKTAQLGGEIRHSEIRDSYETTKEHSEEPEEAQHKN